MKLQTKPNPWSCIGTAFAMVLDIPIAEFFGLIGHDGSQKAFQGLPDPMSRRGLHVQECIAVCLQLGYAVTPVELFPVIRATPPCNRSIIVHYGTTEKDNWQRFEQLIKTSTGVIDGVGRRCRHAVAYDYGRIYDPDGYQYDYCREACEARGFITRCAWCIDRIARSPQ